MLAGIGNASARRSRRILSSCSANFRAFSILPAPFCQDAKYSSDTYASTLWALDCTYWWAAHHILGMNYHTGESVGRDGKFGPPNYASFLRQADGPGFTMRPQTYALLAFTQGAHGQPLGVTVQATNNFNFNAYAYQDKDGSIYVTL